MAEYVVLSSDPETRKAQSASVFQQAISRTYFKEMMGNLGEDSPLIVLDELKGKGDNVTYPLLRNLSQDGFTEGETAEGNAEALDYYTDSLTINELLFNAGVAGKGSINDQRTVFTAYDSAAGQIAKKFAERWDVSLFNHLCGYTAETNTKFTGFNSVTAYDSGHILRVASVSNDQSLGSSNTFKLTEIPRLLEIASTASDPIQSTSMLGMDGYFLFLHPTQVRDLRNDTTSGLNYYDFMKARIQGGELSGSPLGKGYLGSYLNVHLFESNYIRQGIHSGTGAAVSSTRRAVFVGAGAATAAFGILTDGTKFDLTEVAQDHGRQIEVCGHAVFGMKRAVFNSTTKGSLVLSTYAA